MLDWPCPSVLLWWLSYQNKSPNFLFSFHAVTSWYMSIKFRFFGVLSVMFTFASAAVRFQLNIYSFRLSVKALWFLGYSVSLLLDSFSLLLQTESDILQWSIAPSFTTCDDILAGRLQKLDTKWCISFVFNCLFLIIVTVLRYR